MQSSTDVLVVGGGPVGLMVAIELQRRGIDHLLIDQRPEPEYYCKALGITPRTLEVWDQIGVLEEALRYGFFTAGFKGALNRQETDTQDVPVGTMPYGFFMLAQYDTERVLNTHLRRHGGYVARGVKLIDLAEADDGMRARVTDSSGRESTIDCRYVVGCDGAHSAVRKSAGIEYEGDAYPMTFMLGDVRVHWNLPRPYGYRFTGVKDGELQNVVVCIGVPGDPQRYRLSMAAPQEYWEEHARLDVPPTLEQLQQAAAPHLPADATISDLRWSGFYRISHRIVPSYREGRIFLAGDAAHIHPPIGGQGMNTGLQDAHNLAWKLALAVRGRAAADLLDSYDAERRPVGLAVVERTTQRMNISVEKGEVKLDQWMEDSQLLINYRGSRWVATDGAADALTQGLQPGDRAPDASLRREWVAHPTRLKDLLRHTGHTLLLYVDEATSADEYASGVRLADTLRTTHGDDLVLYGIASPGARPIDHERFPFLSDAEESFKTAYGAPGTCLYLIRPDGYLSYRARGIESTGLADYLRCIFHDA